VGELIELWGPCVPSGASCSGPSVSPPSMSCQPKTTGGGT
jgi:hypothetical protein